MDADEIRKTEAQIARKQRIRAWLQKMAADFGYEGDRAEAKVEEWMVDPANVDWNAEFARTLKRVEEGE